jgi:hypothetical protein
MLLYYHLQSKPLVTMPGDVPAWDHEYEDLPANVYT